MVSTSAFFTESPREAPSETLGTQILQPRQSKGGAEGHCEDVQRIAERRQTSNFGGRP
jgi:hypothetical protein